MSLSHISKHPAAGLFSEQYSCACLCLYLILSLILCRLAFAVKTINAMKIFDDAFYQKLLYQLTQCESKIPIGKFISSSHLQQITYRLKSAYPALFHLSSFICEQSSLFPEAILYPQYIFSKDQYVSYMGQISEKTTQIKRKLNTLQSCLDKEAYVHDYLCGNVQYLDNNALSHCLVGPLLYGQGVCDGISQATQFLLKTGGIQSYVVFGEAKNALISEFLPHAWNVIEVDKKWYHLDVTFDLSISNKSIRYDYYNLSTAQINKDHQIKYIPSMIKCNSESDYYSNRKLVFRDYSVLKKYFNFVISKKKEHFQFKFDTPYNDKLYRDIHTIWKSMVQHYNLSITYQISVNYARSIFAWDVQYQ